MGCCSSMKGSETQIVCSDADWGKTRLTQPDSTRLLSPSLEEGVIFCSISASSFTITPPTSHFAVLHLPFFVFRASHSFLSSLLSSIQFPNLAFACYLSHFGTSVLSSSTSPPPYHSASIYPFFRHVEPVKVISVLEGGGGGGAKWCSYIQLLLWITGRGWMDKSRSRKDSGGGELEFPASFLCMLMRSERAAIRTLTATCKTLHSSVLSFVFISHPPWWSSL